MRMGKRSFRCRVLFLTSCHQYYAPYPPSCLRRTVSRTKMLMRISETRQEPAMLNPQPLDPSLTLTRTQYPAIVGNTGNTNPFRYRGFANSCNAQQHLTAHS